MAQHSQTPAAVRIRILEPRDARSTSPSGILACLVGVLIIAFSL